MQKIAVAKRLEVVTEEVTVNLPPSLLAHPALAGAQLQTLVAMSEKIRTVKLPRGAALFRVEEDANEVFFIISGTILMQHRNAESETFESDWLSGSTMVGVAELFSDSPVFFETARIEQAVEAYAVPMAAMRQFISRDHALAVNCAKALGRRVARAIVNERATLEPAFVRIAKYLTNLAQREGREVAPELVQIHSTQDDVAAATGLNPRTVARAMKALQKEGRVYVRRGEYLIRQPHTLHLAVGGEETN